MSVLAHHPIYETKTLSAMRGAYRSYNVIALTFRRRNHQLDRGTQSNPCISCFLGNQANRSTINVGWLTY